MLLVDGTGRPLSIDVDSARPGEVTLIEPLLEQAVVSRLPNRLIYDRAADSDPLRARLAHRGVELICPHRRGRKRPATMIRTCCKCEPMFGSTTWQACNRTNRCGS